MAYAMRTVTCNDCNKEITGRYKPKPPWLCFECGLRRMIQHNANEHEAKEWKSGESGVYGNSFTEQYYAKSGPLYEKWLEKTRASLTPPPS